MRQLFLLISLLPWLLASATAMELHGDCQVRFVGSSTLHDFDGIGHCEPFVLQVSETQDCGFALAGATLQVPVAGMQTGISRRDRQMRAMFEADRFPLIAGLLDGGSLAALRRQLHEAAEGRRTLQFRLRIRDVEELVTAEVTGLNDDARGLSFDLAFPLSLAAYRLEAPTVLGLIRVADTVRVRVSLQLSPLPPTPAEQREAR